MNKASAGFSLKMCDFVSHTIAQAGIALKVPANCPPSKSNSRSQPGATIRKYMKYNITPQNIPDALPITEEPLPVEEIAKALKEFLVVMEKQGYWRTTDGLDIPLNLISYKIEVVEEGN
ncbi:MAG TPA: hypothetical protein VIM48_03825 [Chthoniobacterales bacterium]